MDRRDFLKLGITAGVGVGLANLAAFPFAWGGEATGIAPQTGTPGKNLKERKMKAMTVFGSPRKANSEFMAERFSHALESRGVEVTRLHLSKMNYGGCTVCGACKNGGDECVLRDDLTPVLSALKETDIFILAAPLHFYDAGTLVKTMLERWYSYLLPRYYTGENRQTRLPEGKQVVLFVSQGAPVDQFNDFPQRLEAFFRMFNCRPAHLLKSGFGIDPHAAEKNEVLIAEVEKMAGLVFEGKDPLTPIAPYRAGI